MSGRIVWALEPSNHVWWPSKTISPEDVDQEYRDNKLPNSTLLFFFGRHNVQWIKDINIKGYSEEYLDQSLPKHLIGLFKQGIREMEDNIKEDIEDGASMNTTSSVSANPSSEDDFDINILAGMKSKMEAEIENHIIPAETKRKLDHIVDNIDDNSHKKKRSSIELFHNNVSKVPSQHDEEDGPSSSPPRRVGLPGYTSPNHAAKVDPPPLSAHKSPSLPCKLPPSFISTLNKKRSNTMPVQITSPKVSSGVPTSSLVSPKVASMMVKTPITLSFPRKNQTGVVPHISTPQLPSASATPAMQLPAYMKSPAVLGSPMLLNSQLGYAQPLPKSSVGKSDKTTDGECEEIISSAASQSMMAMPMLRYMPFAPPMGLNTSLNMETTFTSPFQGRVAIKGSYELGYQVEATFMGRSFVGTLVETPSSIAKPAAIPTLDPQLMESYRLWYEALQKTQGQVVPQAAGVINSSALTSPLATGVKVPSTPSTSSANHTAPPKTPNILINISKDDQAPSTIETASSSGSSGNNNVAGSGTAADPSNNVQFKLYLDNAFKKLEQFQKQQTQNLSAKQDENKQQLTAQYQVDKRNVESAGGDKNLIDQLNSRYRESLDRLNEKQMDERNKMETTHSQQATKFLREAEKQWMLKQNRNSSSDSLGVDSRSPMPSPSLTSLMSPLLQSPSPFKGSPMVSSLLKGSISSASEQHGNSGHNNHSPGRSTSLLLQEIGRNDNSNSQTLPHLSLAPTPSSSSSSSTSSTSSTSTTSSTTSSSTNNTKTNGNNNNKPDYDKFPRTMITLTS
ncbi:hypothetical protein SAMD00019534_096770 [Acytostelium subglobosum LB1]|uniref:hypothetical protein n=1 Tax=Acytostelium subglobosum LB1 TaxID=1410327 RepID=UPI000644C415|nr:hypothetical protein SAMD00019534_096770 [Acytostelium subglobosum LB1]GAM26502.1 hypothetical protein SAMD00019534_096770 [Acytostelium subglobosum LB1]|eukprot:XP_012750598.1 hypothetical protein SAMD00019534_096770 [Acytostelium subglobosum LB1]